MRTFKILNNTVSFDDELIEYIEIVQIGQSYKVNFNDRYMAKPKENITKIGDFALYIQELYNSFEEEYIKLAEELVNLYIKYGIYDMSKELIIAKNTLPLSKHVERMTPITNEISIFISQVKQGVVDIEEKWQSIVGEAIPGHYFNVYSSSYSDILLNDYFNNKEEKRVEKKRQRLYTENASKTVNDYLSQIVPLCEEYISKIKQVIYDDIIEMIDDIYKNCAMDLATRGKISSFSQYTDNFKSSATLDNINKITSKEVIEEQLVNLLQTDSLNPLIHLKIVEYITYSDIPEYVEIIKFLKLENLILYIYVEDSAKRELQNKELTNKCSTILKSVKDSLDMGFISKETTNFNYIDDTFIETITATKTYFECIKNIFGADNKIINEKEQNTFITAIKEASKGTNLTYDRSITRLDYNYLCEFWEKAKKQRNSTIKRQEITQNVSNNFANWVKNHIMLTIIIIIIIALLLFG